MKILRLIISASLALIMFSSGCAKKEDITHFDAILRKWCRAVRDLNYSNYRECEAYPKSFPVFQEMYRDFYLDDIMIVDIEEPDDDNKKKDPAGDEFKFRAADFECTEVSRKTGKPTQVIRGNVLFVRFLDGPRKDAGWLMSNRTLVRIKR